MSSRRDREILNAIVNPLLPVGEGVFDDEENVPQDLKDPPTQDSKETRCTVPDCNSYYMPLTADYTSMESREWIKPLCYPPSVSEGVYIGLDPRGTSHTGIIRR